MVHPTGRPKRHLRQQRALHDTGHVGRVCRNQCFFKPEAGRGAAGEQRARHDGDLGRDAGDWLRERVEK